MMLPLRLALLVMVSAGLLSGCGGSRNGTASVTGSVSCVSGPLVTQGSVGVYRGRPFANCLLPCEPASAPLVAEQRLASNGRFDLSISLGDMPGDLWVLAQADGQSCGSGYNFESQPLGPIEDGQRLELTLVISPFVT
jgi:hypothetical protein